jgi:DNA-binding MarR family transcriptional regulator
MATRLLNESERIAWIRLALVSQGIPALLDAQLRADSAITHFEYLVLNFLDGPEGPSVPMTRLAELTSGSLSRLSHVVARLEKAGYATRSRSADDGRVTVATITPTGKEVFRAAAPGHVANIRRLVFDHLDPEDVATLGTIMAKLVPSVDPHGTLGPLAR